MTSDRKDVGLMRKGVIGDWRNHYSKKQQEDMDRLLKRKLDHLGLSFDDDKEQWNYKASL